MNNLIPTSNNLVEIKNGKVFANSLKVAEFFNKNHKEVLRTIKALEINASFRERNFALSEYSITNSLGRTRRYPMYEMTKDGFTLLAMGFNGADAMEFKIKYIEAFNRMEEVLKQQQKAQTLGQMSFQELVIFSNTILGELNSRYYRKFEEQIQNLDADGLQKLLQSPQNREKAAMAVAKLITQN